MSKFNKYTTKASSQQRRAPGALARSCLLPLAVATALVLSACGGGSVAPGTDNAAAQSISGTAAVGIPLTGTVTVKDAAGRTRTSPIGNNGQYTIDVTGLTAPFVFRAEGTVGGNTYVVHSAATTADVGGTINITPLTDLVLANIAGQVAANYFDQGQFSGVSKAELDAEAGKLKEKLLPMLQAIGVDSSIDLLRTPFTPLASALDTALDQIRISTDSNTNVATITNVVTQQSIQDNLTVKAAAETAPPQMDNVTGLDDAASDIPNIRAALLAFSSKFATGLPATGLLSPLVSSEFLDHDQAKDAFVADIATDSQLVGTQFTNVVIDAIDYSDSNHITAKVGFDIVNAQGRTLEHVSGFRMHKEGGVWRLLGDQRVLDIDGHVLAFQGVHSSGDEPPCRSSGLNFWIEDMDDSNNGGTIAYMIVKGPGLPEVGLRFNAPSTGGNWRLPAEQEGGADGGNFHVLTGNCQTTLSLPDADIAALPANPTYTFTAYTAGGVKVPLAGGDSGNYLVQVKAGRPLTRAELATASFPTFTQPATFAAFAAYAGGNFPVTVTGMNPNAAENSIYLYGHSSSDGNDYSVDEDVTPNANGSYSATLTLSGQSLQGKTLRASTRDSTGRSLVTGYDYYPAP